MFVIDLRSFLKRIPDVPDKLFHALVRADFVPLLPYVYRPVHVIGKLEIVVGFGIDHIKSKLLGRSGLYQGKYLIIILQLSRFQKLDDIFKCKFVISP